MSPGLATGSCPRYMAQRFIMTVLTARRRSVVGASTFPAHSLEDGIALVGGQRVVGQYRHRVAHELGEKIRVGHDSPDQIAEAQRLHTPPWISGDPGGIRTRGLDLERVASWARLDDGV